MLAVAADIRVAAGLAHDSLDVVEEWMRQVGEGVAGYVTPKVAVGAVVGNDDGEILLVQRADSGVWLYPTGWADVGYSVSEVVVKEVREETGIHCEPVRLLAVLDGFRLGFTRIPMHLLMFHCRPSAASCSATRWRRRRSAGSPRTTCRGRSPAPASGPDGLRRHPRRAGRHLLRPAPRSPRPRVTNAGARRSAESAGSPPGASRRAGRRGRR